MSKQRPVLGEPCTVPAWVLSNLVMAAGCGVKLDTYAEEMVEARKALGIEAGGEA